MIELPFESASVMRVIASAGIVIRSNASAGLSGSGTGLVSAALAAWRRREVCSSSRRLALCWGSEITDQCRTLTSFLSASAVKIWVPNERSLGAIVTGTSNSGAKSCLT